MKLLSEQIRDLVSQSPTSSYAIAREAGIHKSAMSRFMTGGNLTMDKLDQLAKVLGVMVTPEVSQVPLPLEKGRPSSEGKDTMELTTTALSKKEAKDTADFFATEATEKHMESRRGVWYIVDLNLLIVYNNNPFQIDPKIRSREMKRIELGLRKIGIRVLASGQAGDKLWGCDDLYTQTLLLDCGEDRKAEVCQIVDKEASQARQEVIATSR